MSQIDNIPLGRQSAGINMSDRLLRVIFSSKNANSLITHSSLDVITAFPVRYYDALVDEKRHLDERCPWPLIAE